jgi:hypothetical protein
MLKPTRQAAIQEMLARLDHRQPLLQAKCAADLVAHYHLPPATAAALTERWARLITQMKRIDQVDWRGLAAHFGQWCARQSIPFAAVMAQLHSYKRHTTPLLVREYPGIEGFLEAHLALDELLTLLMGQIPQGYYRDTPKPEPPHPSPYIV